MSDIDAARPAYEAETREKARQVIYEAWGDMTLEQIAEEIKRNPAPVYNFKGQVIAEG